MKKKLLAGILSAAMIASLMLAGCGSSTSDADSTSAADETGTASEETADASTESDATSEEYASYTIACNDFGAGEYSLDINAWQIQSLCETLGFSVDITDNEFSVDNIIPNLQSQLAQNTDGVVMIGIAETTYASISNTCSDANTPYTFFGTPVLDEDLETIEEDPYYAGTIVFDPELEGAMLAEEALAAGCTTAVICAGSEGDYNHDHRVIGFTEAFEAGGGEVVGVARCADPSEGVTKASDLLSAHMDADCAYGAGAGYITAFETVADNLGLDYKIYGSDVTADLIGDVAEGNVEAISGGANVTAEIAAILLINYLDGCQILDDDGKAPYNDEDLSLFLITAENAEAFDAWWTDYATSTIPMEYVENCLYRYNPDVTYDDIVELLQNYADIVYEQLG